MLPQTDGARLLSCSHMEAAWLACRRDGICLSLVALLGPVDFRDYPRLGREWEAASQALK